MNKTLVKLFRGKKVIFSIIILIFILLYLSGLLQTWENKALDQLIITDYIISPEKI